MATWARPSSRLTTLRKVHEGPVQWTKTLAIGEPELVREVERYQLEIVRLTATHSLGSGTQLLERGWTLHYSAVAQGERRQAGVGLLIAPQLSRHVLEFTLVNESSGGRFPAPWGQGWVSAAVVCVYTGRTAVQSTCGLLGDVPGRGT
ncbi:hypothetical protein L3Q82_007247 [Scortum barcoo]|uniref:Uncharacterized protein n=1 Tax=Scortum barcoo TaxID=214431 RepID=A0ACB8WSS9_9TELE|nr:hypothetical protein L3Q82_007247 [Scortum barcoo]